MASRITNFDPNNTSHAKKNRQKVIHLPGRFLKNDATLCSTQIVALSSTCSSTAASREIVKESTKTLLVYSTNRFSTTRSTRVPVKYRRNNRCADEGASASTGISLSLADMRSSLTLVAPAYQR